MFDDLQNPAVEGISVHGNADKRRSTWNLFDFNNLVT